MTVPSPILLVVLREAGPIQEQATRYRCPHCRRSYAHKGVAAKHMLRCFASPFTRACKTCQHWTPPTREDPDDCARDIDLTMATCSMCGGVLDQGTGTCPNDHRDRPLYGLRVQCPLWEENHE